MTIYVRNRNNKWIKSIDNYKLIFDIPMWFAYQQWWQLLITPKHIILGFYYGYKWKDIKKFVVKHIKDNIDNNKRLKPNRSI